MKLSENQALTCTQFFLRFSFLSFQLPKPDLSSPVEVAFGGQEHQSGAAEPNTSYRSCTSLYSLNESLGFLTFWKLPLWRSKLKVFLIRMFWQKIVEFPFVESQKCWILGRSVPLSFTDVSISQLLVGSFLSSLC